MAAGSRRAPAPRSSSRSIETLAPESYISLATFRRNGVAVETPVWFAILDDKLYVVTDGTSAKVKRVRATKRVRVAPCNLLGSVPVSTKAAAKVTHYRTASKDANRGDITVRGTPVDGNGVAVRVA